MDDLDRASRAAGRRSGSPRPSWWEVGALAALLALYLGLALTSAERKSVTVDELGHLPSGFYYLKSCEPRHLLMFGSSRVQLCIAATVARS